MHSWGISYSKETQRSELQVWEGRHLLVEQTIILSPASKVRLICVPCFRHRTSFIRSAQDRPFTLQCFRLEHTPSHRVHFPEINQHPQGNNKHSTTWKLFDSVLCDRMYRAALCLCLESNCLKSGY